MPGLILQWWFFYQPELVVTRIFFVEAEAAFLGADRNRDFAPAAFAFAGPPRRADFYVEEERELAGSLL